MASKDNLRPFVEVNPYKDALAKAEQFAALLTGDSERIDQSMSSNTFKMQRIKRGIYLARVHIGYKIVSNNFDVRKMAARTDVGDTKEDYYILCGWMGEGD